MTTICYKDGVLAADSLVANNGILVGTSQKVFKIGSDMFGIAGNLADISRLKEWSGPDSLKDLGLSSASYVYWIDESGVLREIEEKTILPIIEAPFHSCGSGSSFALGAMEQGATAAEAVKIAAIYDLVTNDVITEITQS